MSTQNSSAAISPSSGLGRIIFERKESSWELIAPVLAIVVLVGAEIAIASSKMIIRDKILVSLLFISLIGFCIVWFLDTKAKRFRCHEKGVYYRGIRGEQTLKYEDLEAFAYSAVRNFQNGVYQGTQFIFSFEPMPGMGARKIHYSVTLHKDDDELDRLRDGVSQLIASRWVKQIQAGQPVAWTPNLKFVPGGIEYIAQGFVGKKEPVLVPFERMERFAIENGEFHVWLQGEKKPAIKENMGRRNFFPGYVLFQSIVGE